MSAPKHTPTPAPDTCQICGAWKGLHQYETMLCPKNGREEMRIGVDQQWETTVYKEQPAPANEKFYWVADAPDCFFLREHGSEEQFFAKCITVENAIRICVALNGARAPLLEERNAELEKRVEELTAALKMVQRNGKTGLRNEDYQDINTLLTKYQGNELLQ